MLEDVTGGRAVEGPHGCVDYLRSYRAGHVGQQVPVAELRTAGNRLTAWLQLRDDSDGHEPGSDESGGAEDGSDKAERSPEVVWRAEFTFALTGFVSHIRVDSELREQATTRQGPVLLT